MRLVIKGKRGGQWRSHKYVRRYKNPKTGKRVYVYKEALRAKHYKYIARFQLLDGSWRYVYPDKIEVDENDQLKGGLRDIRQIMNREFFGEYWYDDKGRFQQRKGIFYEHRPVVRGEKVVVEHVPREDPYGKKLQYAMLEFRDPSIRRAYPRGLPKKMLAHYNEPVGSEFRGTALLPEKKEVEPELPPDVPPVEDLVQIQTVPPATAETETALAEPLTESEDPVALASQLLSTFVKLPKTGANTKAGRERAAKRRKEVMPVGRRRIRSIPAWVVLKWDSKEDFQRDLSRDEDGKLVSTLITLGLWDKHKRYKRAKEQLVSEWQSEIRWHARRAAQAYRFTNEFNDREASDEKAGLEEWSKDSSRRKYMRGEERKLQHYAYDILLEEASKYKATANPMNRFDKIVRNKVMTMMRARAKEIAVGHGAPEELIVPEEYTDEAARKQGPHYTISPKEHFELKHYTPIARKLINEAISDLPDEQKRVFQARFWLPAVGDPFELGEEAEEERAYHEPKVPGIKKYGKAAIWEERPWTGPNSIAAKLSHVSVTLASGATIRLGELEPQHQAYHLKKWFSAAKEMMVRHFKDEHGNTTSEGWMVRRWLRLQSKLADVNRRVAAAATAPSVVAPGVKPIEPKLLKLQTEKLAKRPAIHFWSKPGSNQRLAQRLGVRTDIFAEHEFFAPHRAPSRLQQQIDVAEHYHKLAQRARRIKNLNIRITSARSATKAVATVGRWVTDKKTGSAQWKEQHGVTKLHRTAMKMQAAMKAGDREAATRLAEIVYTPLKERLAKYTPDVVALFDRRLVTMSLSEHDLSAAQMEAHKAWRAATHWGYILDFERRRRTAKATPIGFLRKALDDYDFALGRLCATLAV